MLFAEQLFLDLLERQMLLRLATVLNHFFQAIWHFLGVDEVHLRYMLLFVEVGLGAWALAFPFAIR